MGLTHFNPFYNGFFGLLYFYALLFLAHIVYLGQLLHKMGRVWVSLDIRSSILGPLRNLTLKKNMSTMGIEPMTLTFVTQTAF